MTRMSARVAPVSALLVAWLQAGALAVTVTLNPGVEYQRIDGFGGFGGMIAEYADGSQGSDAWVNLIANDLGLTIHRYFLNPNDLEPSNDNSNPLVTDLARFNLAGRLGGQMPLLSKLKAAGVSKFFFSLLSPPYWMKQGPFNEWCYDGADCSCCGGKLPSAMYDEFAEFCAAYVSLTKRESGVDLYALSIQNEPRFSEPYPACVYAATELRDAAKKVGARLVSEGLGATKLMVAEDVLSTFGTLEGACMADTACRKYIGVIGTHAYSDGGVGTIPSSQQAILWGSAARRVATVGLPLWMTETSGYENSWAGCLNMVQGLYTALKFGKVSGWVYYRLGGAGDALTENGQPTWLFYGCKQYFRYVRPDAVSVDIVSDDADVLAVAFVHRSNRTLTIVLTNQGTSSKQITLSAEGLPSFAAYRTSGSERCVSVGTVSGPSVTLPASSITTLYGTGYEPPATAAGPRPPAAGLGRATLRALPCPVHIFSLDGRRGIVAGKPGLAPGVYLDRQTGRAGNLVLVAGQGR